MKSFLFSRKIYAQLFLCSIIALISFWGCKKQEPFSPDLAINAKIVRLAEVAATTRIQVFADDAWQVSTAENNWVTLDKTDGNGKSEFVATVTSNAGQLPRAVQIYVKAAGKTDTVFLQQRGLTPTITLVDANMNGVAGNGKTLLTTNVPFEQIKKEIVYKTVGQADWLSNMTFDGQYLGIDFAATASTEPRQAVLMLSYVDALGATVKDEILITQSPAGDYKNAVLKDFGYIKGLAAGTITEDIYVEGIVILDKGNPNAALNANTATNKHTIDKTENGITVYVQSLDGKSGLRLRMKTSGDHIFFKNEKVKLWLKNTSIARTSNPVTTTINGLAVVNVIEKVKSTTPLTAREVYIKDLVDNDVYTYVKLKDVELSVSAGSIYNINEGYVARTDCYPANIRDIDGNSMYMMTNNDVPYRRPGTQAPQGSGTIAGVLVHESYARFGGNIGKYAIRHTSKEDIQLAEERSQGFSNVLVEWDKFKRDWQNNPTPQQNPLTPSIGTGKLSHSEFADYNYVAANGIYGSIEYNGFFTGSGIGKDQVENGAFAARGWWNIPKNRGGALIVQVSTANVTKPLSMQLSGYVLTGAPTNWVIEWSNQGDMDAGTWNVVSDFTFQDVTNWTSTLLTQSPGGKTMNFNLPAATLGLNNLYIRIKAKSKVAGSATSATGGAFLAASAAYFGHISLKYNK